jgi:Ca2+-binding EF-hand superfamily protein
MRSPRLPVLPVPVLLLLPLLPGQRLAPEQQKFLDEVFARYDGSGDGKVSRAEFPGSDAQFRELDADGDGAVTRAEFAGSAAAKRLLQSLASSTQEPRARTGLSELAARRLRSTSRFDRDRDGRITRAEWSGTDVSFRSLDLDGDGVLDQRDRKLAEAAAPPAAPADPLRAFTQPLAERDALLKKLDRDRDGLLGAAEVAGTDLHGALPAFDRDRDGRLDATELQALVGAVAAAVARRNAGTLGDVPRLPDIPFGAWDADDDGRLAAAEFQQPGLFPAIDADRDGYVTRQEVARAKRALEAADFLGRFDLDDDGRVTAAEFGGAQEVFRRADRNGDGVVSRQDR